MEKDYSRYEYLSEFISKVFDISKDGSKLPNRTDEKNVKEPTVVESTGVSDIGNVKCSKCQSSMTSEQPRLLHCGSGEDKHHQQESNVGYDLNSSGTKYGLNSKYTLKSKFCGKCEICDSGRLWMCKYKVHNEASLHQKVNIGENEDDVVCLKCDSMKCPRKILKLGEAS